MHSKSDNREILIDNDTDEIIGKLFNSLLHKYQTGFKELMKGSEFVFDYIDTLFFKCHKIRLNRAGSYLDFPELIKNKK